MQKLYHSKQVERTGREEDTQTDSVDPSSSLMAAGQTLSPPGQPTPLPVKSKGWPKAFVQTLSSSDALCF